MIKSYPLLLLIFFTFNLTAYGQEEYDINLAIEFDMVDADWHALAKTMNNYEGFQEYCENPQFKKQVEEALLNIHYLDSLILNKLTDYTYIMDEKERASSLKEISKFETKYSVKRFTKTLKEECHERHNIEHNKKKTKKEFGINSYDGQKLVLEVELQSYINHITKLVDHIDRHAHHID